MELYDEEFPNCCGITVICDFERMPAGKSKDAIETRKEYREHLDDMLGAMGDVSGRLLLVSLTDYQYRGGWKKALKERGFKPLFRFKNSNTGNFVTLLGRGVNVPENTKKPPKQKAIWG